LGETPPWRKWGPPFHDPLVSRPLPCIRRLAGNASAEDSIHGRFLPCKPFGDGPPKKMRPCRKAQLRPGPPVAMFCRDPKERVKLVLARRRAKANGYGKVERPALLQWCFLLHAHFWGRGWPSKNPRSGSGSSIQGCGTAKGAGKVVTLRPRARQQRKSRNAWNRWATIRRPGERLGAANDHSQTCPGTPGEPTSYTSHFARRPPPNVDLERTCLSKPGRSETDEEGQIKPAVHAGFEQPA